MRILVLCTLAFLAPAAAVAQSKNDLVGKWELHTNGKAGFVQYYVLGQDGSYVGVFEDPKSRGRETGRWQIEGGKVVLLRSEANGQRSSARREFAYDAKRQTLDILPLRTFGFCKQSHPHGAVTASVSTTKSMKAGSSQLRKIQQHGYEYTDKKTGVAFSILYSPGDDSYAVESEKKHRRAAFGIATKLLHGEGISSRKIYWREACGL